MANRETDSFGHDLELPEPRPLDHGHEPRYTQPYDRWRPRDYVFYGGEGYHREFIEPYRGAGAGRYRGRGPKSYVRSDERIREDVNERLTDDPELDASEIQVRVDNGEITLEGIVEDSLAKRRAEDIAYSTRGVRDVHNHLRVDTRVREIPIAPGQGERRSRR